MTDPANPPIPRVVRDVLADAGGMTDDLLVERVHAETDAGPLAIRATIGRLEAHGEIYQAGGAWKVTTV